MHSQAAISNFMPRGFRRFTFELFGFAQVFKWYSSEPLQIQTNSYAYFSKSIAFAMQNKARIHQIESKIIQTHTLAHKQLTKREVDARGSHRLGTPTIRITVYMRPRSFASPVCTACTKRKRRRNEENLRVTGLGQAGRAPLNLRFICLPIHKIRICFSML